MGAGRSLVVGVAVALAASLSLARADTVSPIEDRFSFDCSVPPVALDDASRQKLADSVGRRWNLGAASAEALQSKITVRVCLTKDGRPRNLILLAADGPTEEAVDRLFQTARRAVLRVDQDGGLPLPAALNDTWRVLDLVFDANGMTAR